MQNLTIGFIGQGWIGKNYADSFEGRGFDVVRYSNEASYIKNKDALKKADVIFIAVPTPTTPTGYDDSIVREVVKLVPHGKIAVIKSTVQPGTTKEIQKDNPSIFVIHHPEFLREAHVRDDIDKPDRNIIGIPVQSDEHQKKAELLKSILPKSPYNLICDSDTSEFLKYTHNTLGFSLIVFTNLLYDLGAAHGIDWNIVKESILNNPWFPEKYLDPVHKGGRGAGGDCFIKDFASLVSLYREKVNDKHAVALLEAFEKKNIHLLKSSNKDMHLLKGVYGNNIESI